LPGPTLPLRSLGPLSFLRVVRCPSRQYLNPARLQPGIRTGLA
jgi:hypothetical protein